MRRLAGVILAVAFALVVSHPVQGANAYLPSIGPSPLRYEAVPDPDAMFAWKSVWPLRQMAKASQGLDQIAEVATDTNASAEVVMAASSLPATNNVSNATIGTALTPAAVPAETRNLELASSPVAVAAPTDDSSSPVTAQILAGFFQPVKGGKRFGGRNNSSGAAVVLPADIGFTPPSPGAAPESKATYKSE